MVARSTVNGVTGLSPGLFTYSVASISVLNAVWIFLMTCLVVVALFFVAQIVVLLVSYMFSHARLMVKMWFGAQADSDLDFAMFGRLLGCIVIAIGLEISSDFISPWSDRMVALHRHIVALADYHVNTQCTGIPKGARIFMRAGIPTSVAVPDFILGWKFENVSCRSGHS